MKPVLEMKAIKQALVNIKDNLKRQAQNWKKNWSVLVPVNNQKTLLLEKSHKFKLKLKDKLQVNPRHPAYYTLLWIICVDNHCNLYHILKAKVSRYPRRIKWNNSKRKFQDTKVIHKWHLLAAQYFRYLLIELGRFIIEECLSGCQ